MFAELICGAIFWGVLIFLLVGVDWIIGLIRPGIPFEESEYEAYSARQFARRNPPYMESTDSNWEPETDGVSEAAEANKRPELYEETIKYHSDLKNVYYDLKVKYLRHDSQHNKQGKDLAVAYAKDSKNLARYREYVAKNPDTVSDFSEFIYKRSILINQEAAKWEPVGRVTRLAGGVIFLLGGIVLLVLALTGEL